MRSITMLVSNRRTMIAESWVRRIRRPVVAWALAALVVELVVERVIAHGSQMPAGERLALTLAPLVPSLLFVLALVRMVWHMDELQRLICLESVFIAFVSSLALTFIFGALQQAGVYRAPWDTIGTAMLALWGAAYLYSSWKYR
jgi:hypothetical protein